MNTIEAVKLWRRSGASAFKLPFKEDTHGGLKK